MSHCWKTHVAAHFSYDEGQIKRVFITYSQARNIKLGIYFIIKGNAYFVK